MREEPPNALNMLNGIVTDMFESYVVRTDKGLGIYGSTLTHEAAMSKRASSVLLQHVRILVLCLEVISNDNTGDGEKTAIPGS